jgi:hypothetical protein
MKRRKRRMLNELGKEMEKEEGGKERAVLVIPPDPAVVFGPFAPGERVGPR